MLKRFARSALPALLSLALGSPLALAQTTPPATPAPAPPPAAATPAPTPALVRVSIVTSEATIVLALEKDRAPKTTANFLRYVDGKRYDGQIFYRAFDYGDNGGMIQGGIRMTTKPLFPPVAHEPTSQTGLHHVDGTISMARLEPGSARTDFFILAGPIPGFDADPAAPVSNGGDNLGFAAFGHVVEGMDVVRKIMKAPRSPTAGDGPMKGQMLDPTVKILTVRRTP